MSLKRTKIYRSFSSKETEAIGEKMAKDFLKAEAATGALVLALKGELGAGKTTFTQGLFRGLGIKRRAQSPTFIIMRRHRVPSRRLKNIFHIDAYRLKRAEQLEVLEFRKLLTDPKNIIAIEWPERARKLLPKSTLWLTFRHGKKENERKIMIRR